MTSYFILSYHIRSNEAVDLELSIIQEDLISSASPSRRSSAHRRTSMMSHGPASVPVPASIPISVPVPIPISISISASISASVPVPCDPYLVAGSIDSLILSTESDRSESISPPKFISTVTTTASTQSADGKDMLVHKGLSIPLSEPVGLQSEPVGLHSKPVGLQSEPVGLNSEALGLSGREATAG